MVQKRTLHLHVLVFGKKTFLCLVNFRDSAMLAVGSSVGTCISAGVRLREIPKYSCHHHCHANNVPSKLDFRC